MFYFPKGVRNRIIFAQWLDTQSGTKTGWQKAQAEMVIFRKAQVLTQFCSSPLMLMCTALENSLFLGFRSEHEWNLSYLLNLTPYRSVAALIWKACKSCGLSAAVLSCTVLTQLLKANSRELSTEWIFRRIQTIVLLNEEDSPAEQTEQDVSESFRQALCCTSVCPS